MQERIAWYRTPLPRDELKKLTARSDWQGFVQTLGFLFITGSTAAAVILSAGRAPVPVTAALLLVHGSVWSFHINAFHELVHGTVFKSAFLNNLFLKLVSFLAILNPYAFKASHTRHHLYTLHQPRDREVILPRRITLRDYLSVAFIDPVGMYRVIRGQLMLAFGRLEEGWQQDIFEEDGEPARRRLINWARFLILGHAAIVTVSLLTGNWIVIVLISGASFYGRWLEFACNEIGGDKAEWIKEGLPSLFNDYPNIKMAVWWNGIDETWIYDIDSTEESLSAFRDVLKDPNVIKNPVERS